MSEKVATGVLSGVVKVSGFFTSSIVNSKVGKKFFSLLPGEIVLASLDGFSMLFISISLAFFNYICVCPCFIIFPYLHFLSVEVYETSAVINIVLCFQCHMPCCELTIDSYNHGIIFRKDIGLLS